MRRLIPLIACVIVVFTGCKSRPVQEDSVDFLTLKGPSAMGMICLIDSPASLTGQKINIEILDEPMMVRARMLKDQPELAVLPLNMAAILYNKGLPYQVLAIPVWGTLYLMGQEPAFTGWESLKGKRVYLMGKGTTPDILFRYLLKHNGLNPDQDVTLDYSFPTHIDLANAVITGKASLAVISEPLVSLAQSKNSSVKQLMDLNREWNAAFPEDQMPQTALMGRKDFIASHPDWVVKICDAWNRSIDWVNRDPAKAGERIAFHKILPDAAVARHAIPGCNLKFSYASDIRAQIGRFLQVFYNFNPDATGGKLPDEEFIFQRPDH